MGNQTTEARADCGTSDLTALLAQTVREAQAAIEASTKEKNAAVNAAEATWRDSKRQHEQRLNELERQYKERAIELAEDRAPVSRSGYTLRPDKVWVTETGIEMRWEADHPYDFVDATVTWEELTANVEVSGLPREAATGKPRRVFGRSA